MNEFLRSFLMQGIHNMIEHKIELYKVYQYAVGWYEKNVLLEEDLREIQLAYSLNLNENTSEKTESELINNDESNISNNTIEDEMKSESEVV